MSFKQPIKFFLSELCSVSKFSAMIIVSAITSCDGSQEGFRRWRWWPFPGWPRRHRDVVQ
jgi:hypothetical protein